MELKEEVTQIRQAGMEKAAVIWEILETLPTPISPVNIFKASGAVKSAEFLARIRTNVMWMEITKLLAQFMDEQLKTAGGEGTDADRAEGFRAIEIIEREMPLTKEIFNDAAAYAQRQHVFDGIILLSAAKMGKENEAKESLDNLQKGCARAMVTAIFKEALLNMAEGETPDED